MGSTTDSITDTFVLRWGSTTSLPGTPLVEFNTAEAVSNAGNKVRMCKKFMHDGVSSPKFWEDLRYVGQHELPVVLRAPTHSKGKGFYVAKTTSELRHYQGKGLYAVKLINAVREYRVFVFNGMAIEVVEKVKTRDGHPGLNPLIRNHKNGYVFQTVNGDLAVKAAGIHAVNSTGLNFGAADVYVDTTGRAGVYEVNSAPGMLDRKCEVLARKFVQYCASQIEL